MLEDQNTSSTPTVKQSFLEGKESIENVLPRLRSILGELEDATKTLVWSYQDGSHHPVATLKAYIKDLEDKKLALFTLAAKSVDEGLSEEEKALIKDLKS